MSTWDIIDNAQDISDPSSADTGLYLNKGGLSAAKNIATISIEDTIKDGSLSRGVVTISTQEGDIEAITNEQSGFVAGISEKGKPSLGFQKEQNYKSDDTFDSSTNLTGAYLDKDGRVSAIVSKQGSKPMLDGSDLSHSIQIGIGTDGFKGSAAIRREWKPIANEKGTGISKYSVQGGVQFHKPIDGSEIKRSAAVLGTVEYKNEMLQKFNAYGSVTAGIYTDQENGISPIAQAGICKDVGKVDVCAEVNHEGTPSVNWKFDFD